MITIRHGRLYDPPVWSRDHDTGRLTAVLFTIVWYDHGTRKSRHVSLDGAMAEANASKLVQGAWLAVTGREVRVAARRAEEGGRFIPERIDLRDVTKVRVLDGAPEHEPEPERVVDNGAMIPF